ncbi:hypothetical protein NBRC116493_32390 [Aurantivibrio infirmus]
MEGRIMKTFFLYAKKSSNLSPVKKLFAILSCGFLFATAYSATAQDLDLPVKNTPKLINGNPDFSGVWVNDGMSFINPKIGEDGSVICIVGCPPSEEAKARAASAPRAPRPKPQRPVYKDEYLAKVKELDERQVELDPALACGNPGLPRIGPPSAIVQNASHIVFLYEDLGGSFFRMIPTDGRDHYEDREPSYLGDSVGKWKDGTLTIEAVNFNDITWLIDDGAFHTDELKVIETLRMVDGKLEYQATAYDPAVLKEPFAMRKRTLKLSDTPMHEPIPCVEMDLDHMVDGSSHDNAR